MKVLVSIQGRGVNIEFHFPVGYARMQPPGVSLVWLPFGRKPTVAEFSRLLCHCVLPDELSDLLSQIAVKFGLRESWYPKEMFCKEAVSSLPPAQSN